MTRLRIGAFGGEIPRLDPDALPEDGAQSAVNTRLLSGGIRGWRETLLVATPTVTGTLLSIYRMYNGSTDYFLSWAYDVDAARGPVAGDTTFKLYYTGDAAGNGWPKKTNLALATGASNYPSDYLEMGVPAPDTVPAIGHSGGVGAAQTRAYVTTWVSSWGEESAPTVATATGKVDDTWTVTPDTSVPAAWAKTNLTLTRIYRAFTNAAGQTDYYFAVERAIAAGAWTDAVTDAVLVTQGILPTYKFGITGSEWSPPPNDLKGLCVGANGIMAGFSPVLKAICFSEPFQPHAWPTRYQRLVAWDPVAIVPVGNSFVALTKGRPYVFSGNHPLSMAGRQVEKDDMPCLSKRSAALSPAGVMFATPNGLAVVGSGAPGHVTDALMSREEWEKRCYPPTVLGRVWNEKYMGFFDTGSTKGGFILDRNNQRAPLTFLNKEVTGIYTDPESNKLYLIQANRVYQWDADELNDTNFEWLSGVRNYSKPWNPGAFRVKAQYSDIAGDFAGDLAQQAIDTALNVTILAAVPVESWPAVPANIMDAIGTHILGGYQKVTTDPVTFGPSIAPNANGIPLGANLLSGGAYSAYNSRSLTFQLYARNPETNAMELKFTQQLSDAKVHRLPSGYKSDGFQVRLSGNLKVLPPGVEIASEPKELEAV